jgi:hypothetical protein
MLFRAGHFEFECGDGWFELLKECIERLSALRKKGNYDIVADQVKEKFGTLRFYLSSSTDEMDKVIEQAEARSEETCENCGKPGSMQPGRWRSVMCKECVQ